MPQPATDYARYLSEFKAMVENLPLEQSKRAADILYRAYLTDHTVFTFGNGGVPRWPRTWPRT